MLRKIPIIWKKVSSKSCLALHSLQKSQWAHMPISASPPPPLGGARRLERLIWLKYYSHFQNERCEKYRRNFIHHGNILQNPILIPINSLKPAKTGNFN